MNADSDDASFRRDVFECESCESVRCGFSRPPGRRGFYKFPPTIGAKGHAPLLFIGINPRISATNQGLHDRTMRDVSNFDELSRNKVRGRRYIAGEDGQEPHYRSHQRLVECVFGRGSRFEEHAAATELFLCATASSSGLPRDLGRCADRWLGRTVRQVQPRVVVAVGKPVEAYLCACGKLSPGTSRCFPLVLHGVSTDVIVVPHPNSHVPRIAPWEEACRSTKDILFGAI